MKLFSSYKYYIKSEAFIRTSILLFILSLIYLLTPSYSYASQTYYFPNTEKTIREDGTIKITKYIPSGAATIQKECTDIEGCKTYYIYSNQISSTTLITDDEGNKVKEYVYYPYGNIKAENQSNRDTTDRLYTGQIKDKQTNLYFYNARYYNPQTASFISADYANDPTNRGNRYLYVGGNPVSRNDPGGNFCESYGACAYDAAGLLAAAVKDSGSRVLNDARAMASSRNPAILGLAAIDALTLGSVSGTTEAWNATYPIFTNPNASLSQRAMAATIGGGSAVMLANMAAIPLASEGVSLAKGGRGMLKNGRSLVSGVREAEGVFYHYTSEAGAEGMVESQSIRAGKGALEQIREGKILSMGNFEGEGVYVTKIKPSDVQPQDSLFQGFIAPFSRWGPRKGDIGISSERMTHYLTIKAERGVFKKTRESFLRGIDEYMYRGSELNFDMPQITVLGPFKR